MSARGGRGRSRGRARVSSTQEPPPRQPGTQAPIPKANGSGARSKVNCSLCSEGIFGFKRRYRVYL